LVRLTAVQSGTANRTDYSGQILISQNDRARALLFVYENNEMCVNGKSIVGFNDSINILQDSIWLMYVAIMSRKN
jgi:hypothetical protein